MPLFGTAGARGKFPDVINPVLVYQVSLAAARLIGGGRGSAVVGYDPRLTSPLLMMSAAAGFMAGGLDTIIVGVAPLPVVGFSVKNTRSVVGASISASHNPPTDNGIKLLKKYGLELFRSEEAEIEKVLGTVRESEWNKVGTFTFEPGAVESYINAAIDSIDVDSWGKGRQPRVMVDCANGAASMVTPRLLTRAGLSKVITINCNPDGRFPGRLPEPRKDVLDEFAPMMESYGADVLFAHDGDADRLAVMVKGLGFVKQDLVIALLARRALRDRKGDVIVSVDVGREVDEVVEKMGGKVVRGALGRLHEYLYNDERAVLAAEPWKMIDPKWGLWPDGIYQVLELIDEAMIERSSFAELLAQLPSYPSARLSFPLERDGDKHVLYRALVNGLDSITRDSKVVERLEIDGVRVDMDDGSWILLRPSGTEPKVRVYMQAMSAYRLKELLDRVKEAVASESSRLGVKVLGVEEAVDLMSRRPQQ